MVSKSMDWFQTSFKYGLGENHAGHDIFLEKCYCAKKGGYLVFKCACHLRRLGIPGPKCLVDWPKGHPFHKMLVTNFWLQLFAIALEVMP